MQRSRTSVLSSLVLAAAAHAAPAHARDADELRTPSFLRAIERPRLSLACVDFVGLPSAVLDGIRTEATALLADLGVEASITFQPPAASLDPRAVTLILMNGTAPAQLKREVMGVVRREGSARVLWVYSAAVAAGARLSWESRLRWRPRERSGFALAMARVAVHEVVHLVCPGRDHDPDGLMAQTLGAARLTGARIPVSLALRREFAAGVQAIWGRSLVVARDGLVSEP
jgi:hypothetical protein